MMQLPEQYDLDRKRLLRGMLYGLPLSLLLWALIIYGIVRLLNG